MEYVRTTDWDHPHVLLGGDYKGQYLYSGEDCIIVVTRVPPGAAGPPLHRHPSDQTYAVIRGETHVQLGPKVQTAKACSAVFIPAGLPHRNWNEGDEEEMHLEVIAPGILPGQALVELTESTDDDGLVSFVRDADPSALGGVDFGLDWLVNRRLGAEHAAVYLAEVPAGKSGPPLHVHEFDQFYYVLEGTLSVEIGLERYDVEPDHLVVLPARVPHRQWNEQDRPERHLTIIAPEPAANGKPWDRAVELAATGEPIA